MRNFQDGFETRVSFIGAFSICMTVSLRQLLNISFSFIEFSLLICFFYYSVFIGLISLTFIYNTSDS